MTTNADGSAGTALDAINAALGTAGVPDATSQSSDTGIASDDSDDDSVALPESGSEDAADGDEGANSADGEGSAESEEGETTGEAGSKSGERNPDGTFKKKEPDAAKDAKEPAKKDGEGDPLAAKKAPDPINDPIPKDLKPATQERIRSLVKTAKEVTTERDTVKRDFDYLVQGVQATGATPEQYGETLSWLAMFNSNDPTQQEKALELVETVADRLSTLLGKERSVNDPLLQHADLKEAVAKGQVTAQYAKEIARTRNQQGFRQQLTTQATAQQQQEQAAAQELHTARTDLTALEANLTATDPQYEAKKAYLVPILKPVFEALPPAQWKGAFEKAYKNVKIAAPVRKTVAPGQQPMRARGNPAGGSAEAPNSAMDAVNAALAGMR